ncbi:MAG: transglycosylase SLT domain-containing protein, partial [Bacteroidia bacterium]
MKKFLFSFFGILLLNTLLFCTGCINNSRGEENSRPVDTIPAAKVEILSRIVVGYQSTELMHFVNNSALYDEGWDTLPQPVFWKKIIQLSPDSSIVNVANSRTPVETIDAKNWAAQTEAQKDLSKAWICQMNNLDSGTCLFVSIGRRDFFEHRKTLASIDKAIKVFKQNDVDPWYAQTILLIESPGKSTQHSWAGASGPFQLMPAVARRFGLKVTKTVDERQSLERSAYGASQLLGRMFIPKVKELLDKRGLTYDETALWFRLLVMHTYHAGPGNVDAVLNVINPTEGNMDLIRKMWVNEAKGFKNESQNYSQIALAALLNFNDIIGKGDTV